MALPYYHIETVSIGPITVQVWGFFVALGILVAVWLGQKEVARKKGDVDAFLAVALAMLIGSLIGARLFYVGLFWSSFQNHFWQIFAVWDGGMVFYGGLLGALTFGIAVARKRKCALLPLLDVLAAVFPLGYAIGRIGCHLIRDHMGKITTLPWGFEVAPGVLRHDTALYSIFTGIILYSIVWPLRKRIRTDGVLGIIVLMLYSLARFITDFFRATDLPNSDPRFSGLTISQYVSLGIFLAAACGGWWIFRQKRTNARIPDKES